MSVPGRTGADRALALLDLRPCEDVLWIGRPVPPRQRFQPRDWVAMAAGVGVLLGSAGFAVASGSPWPFVWGVVGASVLWLVWFRVEMVDARRGEACASGSKAVGMTSPAARLAAWLLWNHSVVPIGDPASTRYVVTSHRVVVVGDPRRHDAHYAGGGYISFTPRIVEVLGTTIRSAARSGPNAVLRIRGRGPFGAFVLRSPDDPEGALRAIERMSAAQPSPTTETA